MQAVEVTTEVAAAVVRLKRCFTRRVVDKLDHKSILGGGNICGWLLLKGWGEGLTVHHHTETISEIKA